MCLQGLVGSPVVRALCNVVLLLMNMWPGERPGSVNYLLNDLQQHSSQLQHARLVGS
jgi:hypothetical protein